MRIMYFYNTTSVFHYVHRFLDKKVILNFKKWVDTNYRLTRAKSKLQFLKCCKYNGVFPSHLEKNFCKFKFELFHFRSLKKSERLLHKFKVDALNIEIFDLHREIYDLKKKLLHNTYFLFNNFHIQMFDNIYHLYQHSFEKFRSNLEKTHSKKITWLVNTKNTSIINNIIPIEFSCATNNNGIMDSISFGKNFDNRNIDTDSNLFNNCILPTKFSKPSFNGLKETNDKWFVNLTHNNIPSSVSNILQMGGNFALPSGINDKKRTIHEYIKDLERLNNKHTINIQNAIRNKSIPYLYKLLHTDPIILPTQKSIMSMYREAVTFSKNNRDIIFTRADKGGATVALKKDTYINKVELLLHDKNSYERVKKNPAKKIENELNNILKRWLQKEYITKREYWSLHASESNLPKAYGLPKIHKDNIPFRIIVSSINTALHSFASFLQVLISKNVPIPFSRVTNSFELCRTLSGKTLANTNVMFSLDVVSLFTNVPLDLAIVSLERRWRHLEQHTCIPMNEFLMAIRFVLTLTFFTFNDNIYKQTFGTPMGSPLSPVIADLVMQDLEEHVIESLDFYISSYFRYVDDIIVIAPRDHVHRILDGFNGYHKRLKFTLEMEHNNSLSFLDLLLIRRNNKIYIDWYQKKTFSGRILSYHSNHPICHKLGSLYGLIDRALLLSHPMFHTKNIEFCINILLDNGYPLDLIFREVNKRLIKLSKKVAQKQHGDIINNNDGNEVVIDEEEKRFFVILPYIEDIINMIKPIFKNSNVRMGFRCLNKLNNLVRIHKDKTVAGDNNNLVYKLSCGDCDATYVGQTKRHLNTRIKEHMNNIKRDPSGYSVISEHIINSNHKFDWKNARILDIECNYNKRLISEMLHIKEQKVGLNAQRDTELLDDSYSSILEQLAKMK